MSHDLSSEFTENFDTYGEISEKKTVYLQNRSDYRAFSNSESAHKLMEQWNN
jgi:hypothetical protein